MSVAAVRAARIAALALVAVGLALLYLFSEGFRSEVWRAAAVLGRGEPEAIRAYILSHGAWAPVASSFLMIFQAVAAPLPSFVITFANGLAFGVFWGWLLSLFGHALAAAVCFGISRALGRAPVEALAGAAGLESADRWFARWGVYAVFLARLVPGISFDVISFAAGVTRMGFGRFMVATTAGIAPQTFFYSYLGREAPQYIVFFLVFSAVVVAGAVLLALLRARSRRSRNGEEDPHKPARKPERPGS